jgi:hypothetical protein
MWLTCLMARMAYYVAWTLADLICTSSGLSFSGYDLDGKPNWDLATSVDIWKFEVQLYK